MRLRVSFLISSLVLVLSVQVVAAVVRPEVAAAEQGASRATLVQEGDSTLLAQRRKAQERGLLDGIPMGSFAISLAISALIGAAGGKVYAGIMGPRA